MGGTAKTVYWLLIMENLYNNLNMLNMKLYADYSPINAQICYGK